MTPVTVSPPGETWLSVAGTPEEINALGDYLYAQATPSATQQPVKLASTK